MQRIAFGGDMKLLKNTYTQCVCLTGLVLLIGGCAASSTGPVTAKSTGTTYECEAGDTSWECRAQGSETTVQSTPSTTAVVEEDEQASESTRANSSWWSIRTRGGETTNRTSRNDTKVATNERRQRRAAVQAEAPKQEARTVAKTETPKRERRGFFNIRVRGQDSAHRLNKNLTLPKRNQHRLLKLARQSIQPVRRHPPNHSSPLVRDRVTD